MKGLHAFPIALAAALPALVAAEPDRPPRVRALHATYVGTVESVPAGLNRLEVWIPLPEDAASQRIRNLRVVSPYPGEIRQEKVYGNSYFYFAVDRPRPGSIEVRVHFDAERSEMTGPGVTAEVERATSREQLERALKAENLVTLSPRIRELARQVTLGHDAPESKARAIYDYLINTMTYDKTVPGWGQGDSERACDVASGNCTDFHSLFLSLARAEGIPARFVIGFPIKSDAEGSIPGYHCWAEFHVSGKGWIPVDASDASKSSDPKRRDYLFGNLDPDRIQFTTGRDLRLDPPPCAETLNYFIYPHAEGDGRAITPVSIRLDYRGLAPGGGVGSLRDLSPPARER